MIRESSPVKFYSLVIKPCSVSVLILVCIFFKVQRPWIITKRTGVLKFLFRTTVIGFCIYYVIFMSWLVNTFKRAHSSLRATDVYNFGRLRWLASIIIAYRTCVLCSDLYQVKIEFQIRLFPMVQFQRSLRFWLAQSWVSDTTDFFAKLFGVAQ